MRHEKTIKKADGSRVRIAAELIVDHGDTPKYRYRVATCAAGKRTWVPALDTNAYSWRKLDYDARVRMEEELNLSLVTREQVLETLIEMWQAAKPTLMSPTPCSHI